MDPFAFLQWRSWTESPACLEGRSGTSSPASLYRGASDSSRKAIDASAVRRICGAGVKLSIWEDWSRATVLGPSPVVAARGGNDVPRVTDAVDDFSYAQNEVCCLQAFY
jgi:hypothetical protein